MAKPELRVKLLQTKLRAAHLPMRRGSRSNGMIARAMNSRRRAWAFASLLLVACEHGELLGRIAETDPSQDPYPPRRVPGLSLPEARDTDPSFTGDLLELYFMSDRAGSKDLWRARRNRASLPWGAPEPVAELNTELQEENPTLANDGMTLWFFTDRDRSQASIWQATRGGRDEPWSEPTPLPEFSIGPGSSSVEVGVDESGTLAVLSARPMGSGSYDLYVSRRTAPDERFSEPELLPNVNDEGDDFDGTLIQGGLILAFHAERGASGDIWFSVRSSLNADFSEPAALEAVNTSEFEESAPALSTDRRYVMFSSDREGSHDIFEAVLAP